MTEDGARVEVFGIRHHGPGSARSLVAALEAYQPDAVLIEGPADADPLLHWVLAEGMEPPLALLAYAPDLPKLPVGRAIWKPAPNFATSAACWLAAGAAHHTVMTTAVGIEVFRDFAEIAKTELVVIDEDSTVRDFQRELRWNQAYYRLAQGL